MKELSVEEKAKSYDKVSKEVKDFFEGKQKMYSDVTQTLEYLFPELCESEDERIRKEIISWLKNMESQTIPINEYNSAIVWLEKQGEITKEWSEMKMNNIQTELQEMVNLKRKTEQGEQNPADVSRKEDIELTEFEDALYTTFSDIWQDYMLGKEINVVDFVREHSDELLKIANKQKPTEWSEEDEVKINRIVACLENLNVADNDILLKDIDWLKSLRPHNHWKPSDEQIKALTHLFEGHLVGAKLIPKDYDNLKVLLGQLKKLREG